MSSPKQATAPEESAPKSSEHQSQQPSPGENVEVEREAGEGSESDDDRESGEASEDSRPVSPDNATGSNDAPPLPNEPTPGGPPLPNEPVPQPADDGWDCQWDPNTNAWFFINRFTGKSQWDNPRTVAATVAATDTSAETAPGTQPSAPLPPATEKPAAGGYNPAIHGDYDPNAWYAQGDTPNDVASSTALAIADPSSAYASTATFNRFTGQFQTEGDGPERHNDEAKSRRQMNAFFDVDAAANSHDGRSLKAERSGKKPSKQELKAFKEKRRVRKEEKRRAWLRD